ncbi:hypothetical protein [Arthrobacter sp. AL12]|uniref:hypothetical protein n=1 Tax=Arthrobacter sp. AL12 TaxID=3042241 RepID=UPI00249B95D3|nr:hypothetical protein [Arthrobacter sp. AL12]MDI3213068.1 hypothetical protein [Arthrobacter sp. AL12]
MAAWTGDLTSRGGLGDIVGPALIAFPLTRRLLTTAAAIMSVYLLGSRWLRTSSRNPTDWPSLGFFILGIIAISLVSRIARTTELRADIIRFDDTARRFIADSLDHDGALNLIAHRRQADDPAEYAEKEVDQRGQNAVPGTADVIFLEIDIIDPSNFEGTLDVHGVDVDGHRILRVESPAAPNAIAAILLALRDTTGVIGNGLKGTPSPT